MEASASVLRTFIATQQVDYTTYAEAIALNDSGPRLREHYGRLLTTYLNNARNPRSVAKVIMPAAALQADAPNSLFLFNVTIGNGTPANVMPVTIPAEDQPQEGIKFELALRAGHRVVQCSKEAVETYDVPLLGASHLPLDNTTWTYERRGRANIFRRPACTALAIGMEAVEILFNHMNLDLEKGRTQLHSHR
jgi:hypothetical protein